MKPSKWSVINSEEMARSGSVSKPLVVCSAVACDKRHEISRSEAPHIKHHMFLLQHVVFIGWKKKG